ncbi:L-histidine N(alpha)-methyltransferase [Streptomonospora nanhaiensis]|uniref:Histidine N-alpha-methyltransferase n=1 Tax=Streptomonospora nanhaiensis TaxID=1323731 RepID=A0A853BLR3_9ACTN|nr:L-histidine N(alpha)-methyltransferase [Streptomonospora nanhaiensis]MBX9389584.1 L-histidine N(alpha)-methyltransferase [Streptomonospora nanhaiensis]NYI95501.1 L-histidine N-alpha-methyltransferase [Streptomonospora nanhaiensis]
MLRIDQYLTTDDLAKALRRDVAEGLGSRPRSLPPKWFYDERGSALFEEITRLAEYYPTRAERAILLGHAPEIARASGADTLVELGAGSGEKTRLLLDALRAAGTLRRFVPVDVSGAFLRESAAAIGAGYPGLEVHAVVADFERHLHLLPSGGRRAVAVLGSTLGNQPPDRRAAFLADLREGFAEGDTLLLGLDLVKDPARLVAAYDDARGVTAEFNRNVLRVLNRELDADLRPEGFDHVAVWDPRAEWIEMRLRARSAQRARVRAIGLEVDFAAGEEVRTEISAKFRREGIAAELRRAGFGLEHWWTDPAGDFALLLARP